MTEKLDLAALARNLWGTTNPAVSREIAIAKILRGLESARSDGLETAALLAESMESGVRSHPAGIAAAIRACKETT